MAERRMFAKTIVLSDAFLDMPMSARCLYFTLGMLADDDGFVNAPRSIMRQCGSSEDDMRILISKKFVLEFESGVIVIKHWRINNYLRNDRYVGTKYVDEKARLAIDEKGGYHLPKPVGIPNSGIPSNGIPSIGKDSIGKDNIIERAQKENESLPVEKKEKKDRIGEMFAIFYEAYGNKRSKKTAEKAFRKINPSEELFKTIMKAVEEYHHTRKWLEGYRKEPATWLNGECWNDEYSDDHQPKEKTKKVSAQQYEQREYTEAELLSVSDDLIAEAKANRG